LSMTVRLRYTRNEKTSCRPNREAAAVTRSGGSSSRRAQRPAHERLSGDLALYGCSCGYVFKATVSTSVGCPHCGQTQAW
jgi:hypothetical protein